MDSHRFVAPMLAAGDLAIVRLPSEVSEALPSRGIVLIQGLLNGCPFKKVLEPDGQGGHWFPVEPALIESAGLSRGSTASVEMKTTGDWPEPDVPADLMAALGGSPEAGRTWAEATPLARWDWIRWIRSTANPETRARRIAAACDKLAGGERRACCFNRNLCSYPELSRQGALVVRADRH